MFQAMIYHNGGFPRPEDAASSSSRAMRLRTRRTRHRFAFASASIFKKGWFGFVRVGAAPGSLLVRLPGRVDQGLCRQPHRQASAALWRAPRRQLGPWDNPPLAAGGRGGWNGAPPHTPQPPTSFPRIDVARPPPLKNFRASSVFDYGLLGCREKHAAGECHCLFCAACYRR